MDSQILTAYMEDVKFYRGRSGQLQNGWGKDLPSDFYSWSYLSYIKGIFLNIGDKVYILM